MSLPKVCAVDAGYGYVKSLKSFPFPSVLVKTSSDDFSKTQDTIEFKTPFLISFENSVYALGDTAMKLSRNPITLMEGNERWTSEEFKALVLGGIVNQLPKGQLTTDVILVTGLPYLQSQNPTEIQGMKDTFTRKFRVESMEHDRFVTKEINIIETYVMSQPRGAYYGLLSLTQKRIKNELSLIADLGFKSLDYLVTQDGQETSESNGEDSIAGMERVYTSLIRELRTKGLPSVKPHELDSWLFNKRLENYTPIIERHLRSASDTIVHDIREKLGALWEKIGMIGSIYFVGGSAKRLKPYLEEKLDMKNVHFVQDSQRLIVEGYGAYGRAIYKKTYGGDYVE